MCFAVNHQNRAMPCITRKKPFSMLGGVILTEAWRPITQLWLSALNAGAWPAYMNSIYGKKQERSKGFQDLEHSSWRCSADLVAPSAAIVKQKALDSFWASVIVLGICPAVPPSPPA